MTILNSRLVLSQSQGTNRVAYASAPSLNCALATCIIHYIHTRTHTRIRTHAHSHFMYLRFSQLHAKWAGLGGEVIIAYYGNWVQ